MDMTDKTRRRPTIEDLQREMERTRVQIREVEHPARRQHPPRPPRDIEPAETPPAAPTLH
jgi:hypothetical protein